MEKLFLIIKSSVNLIIGMLVICVIIGFFFPKIATGLALLFIICFPFSVKSNIDDQMAEDELEGFEEALKETRKYLR